MASESFISRFKPWVETIAIVGAAVWAGVGFAYPQYVTSRLPPQANLVCDIQQQRSPSPGFAALQIDSTIRNHGSRRLHIIGYWFNLLGFDVRPHPKPTERAFGRRIPKVLAPGHSVDAMMGQPLAMLSAQLTHRRLLATGRFVSDGFWLDPDDELKYRQVVFVDTRQRFVRLAVYASVAGTRNILNEWTYDSKTKQTKQPKYVNIDGRKEAFDAKNPRHMKRRRELGLSGFTASSGLVLAPLHPSELEDELRTRIRYGSKDNGNDRPEEALEDGDGNRITLDAGMQ